MNKALIEKTLTSTLTICTVLVIPVVDELTTRMSLANTVLSWWHMSSR